MKKNTLAIVKFVIASIACLSITTNALADGNYPGSTCVKTSGPSPAYGMSTMGNPSSSARMYVDCPMVKNSSSSIKSGWMRVMDRHPSQAIDCTLMSAYASGNTVYYYSTSDASAGSAASWQKLTFGSLAEYDEGYYYYSCSLPPTYNSIMSGIGTYHLNEN